MLLSHKLFIIQSQPSVKFSYFIFLPPEVSDTKITGGVHVPQHLHQGALMLLSLNFFMPQSQSSVIKFSSSIFSCT